jgi:chromosome segregation ATPase
MKRILIACIAAALLTFTSCESDQLDEAYEEQREDVAEKVKQKGQALETERQLQERYQEVQKELQEQRRDVRRVESELSQTRQALAQARERSEVDLEAQFAQLRQAMRTLIDNIQAAAEDDATQQQYVRILQSRYEIVKHRMEQLRQSDGANWSAQREQLETALQEFEEGYRSARESLQMESES